MSTVMSAIVVLALAASFAAALVFAAKWQEARQKILDERSVWLTEIKRVERDKQILIEGSKKDTETISCYLRQIVELQKKLDEKQNKLSAILCPKNNHVWVDGVCRKCGMKRDGQD